MTALEIYFVSFMTSRRSFTEVPNRLIGITLRAKKFDPENVSYFILNKLFIVSHAVLIVVDMLHSWCSCTNLEGHSIDVDAY